MPVVRVPLHQLEPMAKYPEGSTFAERIKQLKPHKVATAIYVVQKFLGPGMSMFISDGSSSFYVGLELFNQGRSNVEVRTNNLAIAHEYPLWPQPPEAQPPQVSLAGGTVNRDLVMVCGEKAEDYTRTASAVVQYMVLSVRRLFADEGPTGVESESLRIKQAAIASPTASIIMLADCEKLSSPYTPTLPRVYRSLPDWAVAMTRNLYVVSTCRPDVDYAMDILRTPPQRPSTPREHYLYNRWRLDNSLRERFVEVFPIEA